MTSIVNKIINSQVTPTDIAARELMKARLDPDVEIEMRKQLNRGNVELVMTFLNNNKS